MKKAFLYFKSHRLAKVPSQFIRANHPDIIIAEASDEEVAEHTIDWFNPDVIVVQLELLSSMSNLIKPRKRRNIKILIIAKIFIIEISLVRKEAKIYRKTESKRNYRPRIDQINNKANPTMSAIMKAMKLNNAKYYNQSYNQL